MPSKIENDSLFIASLIFFGIGGVFFLVIFFFQIFRTPLLPTPQVSLTETTPVSPAQVELVDRVDSGEILRAINQARVTEGLAEFVVNENLNKAARAKVADMCDRQYWSHNGPDGTQPWFWFKHVGYEYAKAGENLGKNYVTSQELIDAWLDSPSHRQNIMNQAYTETGIASLPCLFEDRMTEIVVQFFAQPAQSR